MLRAILLSMRPAQWTKNLFVFAGLLFTLDQGHTARDYARMGAVFLLYCVISGGIYLINDIVDVEQDRLHPRKRKRPIASGRLPVPTARAAAAVLLLAGLAISYAIGRQLAVITLLFAVLLVLYSFVLKHLAVIDVMTIAAGFDLRAFAGATALGVSISPWLFICTTLIALFLGLAKRREEIVAMGKQACDHRACLDDYSIPFLDQAIGITAACTIIAYALYTFFSETGRQHPFMMATLPFVIYGIFRYLLLVHNGSGVDTPEQMLLSDRPLQINVALWILSCALIVKML